MLHGIDISNNNAKLIKDYPQIFQYVDFAIMKVTEGNSFHDAYADKWALECDTRGIGKGYYHFARAEKNSPVVEAAHFVNNLPSIGDAVLVLDVEADAIREKNIDEWCGTWVNCVYNATGVLPMIYASQSELWRLQETAQTGAGLWVASWNIKRPTSVRPWRYWAMWQFGIWSYADGQCVDVNFFNGTREQFNAYCARG